MFTIQGQRTVYRLTLVKSWNSEELQNYADLVSVGQPDFIEVKVTQYKYILPIAQKIYATGACQKLATYATGTKEVKKRVP